MSNVSSGKVFGSPQAQYIITESFERIGIIGDLISAQQIQAAQHSINLILSTWANHGWNLFTTRYAMLSLQNNQAIYPLPNGITDILKATLRTSVRQLNGTAFASSGIAQNAFDNNPATACIQTSPNGTIGYSWIAPLPAAPTPQLIYLVGIQSNVNANYTLNLQYSLDGITYITLVSAATQAYVAGQVVWFIIPAPILAGYFQIQETAGATLNISELYFNNQIVDTIMTRYSHDEYMSISNKYTVGRPVSYYFDRQISPVLNIWQVPGNTANYNNLFFSYKLAIEDIGTMLNAAAIPQRFLEALCAELAYRLAVKYTQDLAKIQLLEAIAMQQFKDASKEDTERVPLRIFGDYLGGYANL